MSRADELDAEFFDTTPEIQSAVRNYERFLAGLSNPERVELTRLRAKLVSGLKALKGSFRSESNADEFLQRTVEESGVDRKLFERWWTAFEAVLRCGRNFDTARSLMWAKIAKSELEGDPLAAAKLAAQNLKVSAERIRMEAENENKRFFIELGKCLSGAIKLPPSNDIDSEIVRILSSNPSATAKHGVQELAKKGWRITEENFRVRKQRLARAIRAARAAYNQSGRA